MAKQEPGAMVRISVSDGMYLRFRQLLLDESRSIRVVVSEFVTNYVKKRVPKDEFEALQKMKKGKRESTHNANEA